MEILEEIYEKGNKSKITFFKKSFLQIINFVF
jgi:hypothetical protein